MVSAQSKSESNFANLGKRSKPKMLKSINYICYGLTLLFITLYFSSYATKDLDPSEAHDNEDKDLHKKVFVIFTAVILLLLLDFYTTLTTTMKFVRSALIILILTFIILSGQNVYDIPKADKEGDETLAYVLVFIALGFGLIAVLINIVEMLHNVGVIEFSY